MHADFDHLREYEDLAEIVFDISRGLHFVNCSDQRVFARTWVFALLYVATNDVVDDDANLFYIIKQQLIYIIKQ